MGQEKQREKQRPVGRKRQRQRLEDTTLLALDMEEGATDQRYRQPLEVRKGKGIDSFLEPSKVTQSCQTF